MKSGGAVFDLVKSMTPTEKRYFKTHFSNHVIGGKSDYVALFDLLNSMEEYDKEIISAQIGSAGSLAAKKKHLYEALLRSLRAYHANGLGQIQFQGLMTDVTVLLNKGLKKQAQKRLKKAGGIAQAYSLNFDLLKVNYVERKLFRQRVHKHTFAGLNALQSGGHQLLEGIQKELAILDHYERIFWAAETRMLGERQEWLEEATAFLATLSGVSELSANARLCYHTLYAFYHKFRKEIEEEREHQLAIIRLFEEENPVLMEEYHLQYIRIVNNYLNNCFYRKDHEKAYERIQGLARIQSKDAVFGYQLRTILLSSWQNYFLNKGDFSDAINLAPEIESFLADHQDVLTSIRRLVFNYNIMVSYFLEGVLKAVQKKEKRRLLDLALEKAFQINQEPAFDLHEAYVVKTNVLAAVIRIELEDFLIARTILTRLIARVPRSLKMERKVLQLLKKCTDPPKMQDNLRLLQSKYPVSGWMEELAWWIEAKLRA